MIDKKEGNEEDGWDGGDKIEKFKGLVIGNERGWIIEKDKRRERGERKRKIEKEES